jgi:hypothetical protein
MRKFFPKCIKHKFMLLYKFAANDPHMVFEAWCIATRTTLVEALVQIIQGFEDKSRK